MNKGFILTTLITFTILLSSFALATNVGYVLKAAPKANIISALNELNLSYDLIDDSEILSTDFDNYNIIIVNDDNFGSLAINIPVNEKNSLFLAKSHVDEWSWASSYIAKTTSGIIKGRILIQNPITQNFSSPVTLSNSAGSYYVLPKYPSRARSIDNIISTDNFDQYPIIAGVEPGDALKSNVVSEARGLFFGLEPDNWNNNAKEIFKRSVVWVLYGNDRDNDNIYDDEDNCIESYNPGQEDSDNDGLGDACDICVLDAENDADNDSVCEINDNCDLISNPLQENFDLDSFGNACDEDIDNDSILNANDECEFTKPGSIVNEQGCAAYQLIVINEVEFNPDDEQEEYVELYNKGTSAVNLAGWKMKDSRGRIDVISSGSIASHGYFVFEEWMSTLDFKNNDNIQLLDNENILIDETGFLDDEENDENTWQRVPDGSSNWVFDLATKGLNNNADVIAPVVELTSPPNGEVFLTDTITFNYSVTDNKASSLSCYFYADFDGEFRIWANETTQAGVVNDFVGEDVPDGEFNWNVKCSDGLNEAFGENRTVIVDDKPYLIEDIPEQSWNEDESLDLDLKNYFSDEDNQNLTYNASGNTNVNANIVDGIATLIPEQDWNGAENVVFQACDEDKCIVSNFVQLNVVNTNDAPVLNNIADITASEGQIVGVTAVATDIDGDSLTYTINDTRFSGSNPFEWQTSYSDAGEYDVEIIASDGVLSDSGTVHIIVLDTNEPPHIESLPDINVSEDSGFVNDINLTAYDNDGTIVSYNMVNEDVNKVDCSVSDGKLGITPAENWFGTATCTIQVSDDDGATGSTIVNIIVAPVNDKPVIDSYFPDFEPIIAEDGSQLFSVEWSDVDNSNVEVLVSWYVDNIQANIGNSFTFTADKNDGKDDYNVKVVVSDGSLEDEQTWNVKKSLIPIANTYDGSTTDFSGLGEEELMDVFPLILEKTGKGKIQFLDEVDLRNVVDLDNYAQINSHSVGIDTNIFPDLKNKRARITFYNLSYDKTPTIYYNSGFSFAGGVICPETICSNINYNNGVLVFDVSSFSTFIAGETRTCAQQSGFVFSDKELCNGTLLTAADTDSCCSIRGIEAPPKFENDIDVCESITPELSVQIKNPGNNEKFQLGDTIEVEVKIKNPDEEDISFDVEAYLFNIDEENVEKDFDDKVKVDAGKSETTDFEINIDNKLNADDDYAIFVLAKGDNNKDYCNQDYKKIKIERPEDKLIITKIKLEPGIVNCGGSFGLNFNLENIGDNEQDAYIIVENAELGIYEKTSEFTIEEAGEKDTKKNSFLFNIGDVEPGTYNIDISANYQGELEKASAELQVSCELPEEVVIKENGEKLNQAEEKISKVLLDKNKGQILLLISLIIGIIILLVLIIIVVKRI